jgi:hypothetical protein
VTQDQVLGSEVVILGGPWDINRVVRQLILLGLDSRDLLGGWKFRLGLPPLAIFGSEEDMLFDDIDCRL